MDTLSNGIRVIATPLEGSETVTVIAMFGTGSRYESADINGMSHFLEHMFFKGTQKRPTSLDITRELDSVGAEFNAFTSKEHTAYYVKASRHHLPMAIDVVADMLINSKFDEKELEKEKGVIVEELNMYRDNPLMRINDLFEEVIYRGNPLGWDIGGSAETVRAATREAMVKYKETHYRPDNTVISVAGKLPENIFELLEQAFGSLASPNTTKSSFPQFSLEQTGSRLKVEYKDVEQAQVVYGFPSGSIMDKDEPVEKILTTIMGGNMSSRLFRSIREERGLAYMVRMGTDKYKDTGCMSIHAGLDKEKVVAAINVMKEEIEKIKNEPVSDQELADAKEYMIGKMAITLEDTADVAQWYAEDETLVGKLATPEERANEFRAVTKEDIARVANQYFDFSKACLAIIGPYKDQSLFEELL